MVDYKSILVWSDPVQDKLDIAVGDFKEYGCNVATNMEFNSEEELIELLKNSDVMQDAYEKIAQVLFEAAKAVKN